MKLKSWNTINSYIIKVENAINKAELGSTKLTQVELSIDGMSATKNRIFLNEIIDTDSNYLEIGTWHGSTLVSALYKNKPNSAFAIDNFSQFKADKETFIKNCNTSEVFNFEFFNENCFELSEDKLSEIKDINVYFYDGNHDQSAHVQALTFFLKNLSKQFILIIDDWNDDQVKIGTLKGIMDCKLNVHKYWILQADYNGDTKNWWNGFFVAVCEKPDY